MQFNELKEALQPSVSEDLDKMYTTFVKERGSGDLVAFVTDLYRKQHITQDVLHQLVSAGTLDAELVGTLAGQNADGEETAPAEEAAPAQEAAPSEEAAPSQEAAPSEEAARAEEAAPADGEDVQKELDQSAAEIAREEIRRSDSGERRGGANVRSSRRKSSSGGSGRGKDLRSSGSGSGARASGARSGGRRKTSPKDKLRKTMFGWRQSEEEDNLDTTDLLKREYSFHGLVGEGAMGRVLRAKDLDLMRVVAYKEMSEEIAATPALASKFYGEAQITAQLDHPNIVPVYHLEQTVDGMLAYTMKLIQGRTLEQMIEEAQAQAKSKKKIEDALSLPERLDTFLRMCDAMHYAHSRGVVHRDLKPENIMIGAYGEVYVMDWGISKVVEMSGVDQEKKIALLTEQVDEGDLVIGTPQYMAPEQAHGENDKLSHLSDQYAMGLILYELVSLKPAVTGKTAMKIVMRQQDGEKDPLVHIAGEKIDKELAAIINKSTAHEQGGRYKNVHEFAEDIQRYQRGEEILARPDSFWRKIERWIGKHKQLTASVIGAIILGGISLMLISWLSIAYYNYLSAQERQQLQNLESYARSHASDVDSQFQKLEGLLGVLVASSSEMLSLESRRGKSAHKMRWVKDYDAKTVPGMVKGKAYFNMPMDLKDPAYMLASKDREIFGPIHLKSLTPIRRHFKNVLLRSYSEAAAGFVPSRVEDRIAKKGTPISWAYIGLKSGGYAIYPGHGGIPDAFDVRERPWFVAAEERSKNERGPKWGEPAKDVHGLGHVLSCVQPIFNDADEYMGVAGVDVTFDYLIDDLLPLENVQGIQRILLVDGKGMEVVNSTRRLDKSNYDVGDLRTRGLRSPEFDIPEVVEKIKSRRSGYLEIERGGQELLVVYLLMNSTGWYYVVVGEKNAMLWQSRLLDN